LVPSVLIGSMPEHVPMSARPAAGGGRWILVQPERLAGWLAGFAARHGAVSCEPSEQTVTVTAADGSVAECHVPFPPLQSDEASPYGGLVDHALRPRRVGVLLVRLGGYAAGVFDGDQLTTSKVGSRNVHGRSAAGGWSQQRFARRREGQARTALAAAVDVAERTLVPVIATVDAVVLGGDRRSVDTVMQDPRLAALRPLVVADRLDVPDPKRGVLEQAPRQFRAVRVRLIEP
jgi:hypothetical protein